MRRHGGTSVARIRFGLSLWHASSPPCFRSTRDLQQWDACTDVITGAPFPLFHSPCAPPPAPGGYAHTHTPPAGSREYMVTGGRSRCGGRSRLKSVSTYGRRSSSATSNARQRRSGCGGSGCRGWRRASLPRIRTRSGWPTRCGRGLDSQARAGRPNSSRD